MITLPNTILFAPFSVSDFLPIRSFNVLANFDDVPFRASETARIEREALSALYRATKGNGWLNNRGWLSNSKLKDWNGVGVNARGRVVSLHLGESKAKVKDREIRGMIQQR